MEEEYKRLLEEIRSTYFLIQDEKFVLASYEALRQYGYEASDIVGQHFLSVIAPEARDQVSKIHLVRVSGQEAPERYETIALFKNGMKVPAEILAWRTHYHGRPAVAGILTDITERKKREDDLLRAREQERMGLARELHDDAIQGLLVVCHRLQDIGAGTYGKLPRLAKERMGEVQVIANQVVQELRDLTEDLRPAILQDMGLVPALRWIVGRAMPEGEISAKVSVLGEKRRLPRETELALFRIAQEALNNVRRHSTASAAMVTLKFSQENVTLTIRDNGNGFEVPDALDGFVREGKFGLLGISERVHLLRGTYRVESAPDKGTTVKVEIPA